VVTGYLALVILGRQGLVGRWLEECLGISFAFNRTGAIIVSAIMGFPLLVRSVRLAVELVDRNLEHAATVLGASPLSVFTTVTLPLALPGILTGMILAFARSLGEFGATITFAGNIMHETRTLPLAIHTLLQQPGGSSAAMYLVGLSVALSVAALLASELLAVRLRRRLGGGRC
jgi:molybdate transport system permease protein